MPESRLALLVTGSGRIMLGAKELEAGNEVVERVRLAPGERAVVTLAPRFHPPPRGGHLPSADELPMLELPHLGRLHLRAPAPTRPAP